MLRKFFKNAGLLSITEIIIRLKGLVIIPLLTRSFGTINYGVWAQVGVLVATLSPLIILGTDSAVVRYLPGCQAEKQRNIFAAWFIFLCAITILAAGALMIFKHGIVGLFFGKSGDYEAFLPLAGLTLMTSIVLNSLRNWFRVINDVRAYSKSMIAQAILSIIPVLIVLLAHQGVYELVLYTIVTDSILIAWLLRKVLRTSGWGTPDFSFLSKLLRYGLPLVPAGYALWGLNFMDRLFLVKYSTLADIGIYSVAYSIGYMVFQMLVAPIWQMYPNSAAELFNHKSFDKLQKLFDYSTGAILTVLLPVIVILLILGKPILAIIASSDFTRGSPVIGIITLAYLFSILSSYYEISLGLVHKQYLSSVGSVLACGINVLLNMILIPKYFILGAACATAGAFFFQLVFSCTCALKLTTIKTNFGFLFKIICGCLIIAFVYYVCKRIFLIHTDPGIILLAVLGSIGYVIFLFCTRIITFHYVKQAYSYIYNKKAMFFKPC